MVKVGKDHSNKEFGSTFQFNFVIDWDINSNIVIKEMTHVVAKRRMKVQKRGQLVLLMKKMWH